MEDGALTWAPTVEEYPAALTAAYASALTKIDALDALFLSGFGVVQVAKIIEAEMRSDADFVPFLALPSADDLPRHLCQHVGRQYAAFKKGAGLSVARCSESVSVPKGNRLPWSSIEAYPEWIANQVQLYCKADDVSRAFAREHLEFTLLRQPLRSASVKFDGTNLGKLDTGELMGRNHMVAPGGIYQTTSTAACEGLDVAAVRDALSRCLGRPLGTLCMYGELMCNPGCYGYGEKGLASKWLCFGCILTPAVSVDATGDSQTSEEVATHGPAALLGLSEALASKGFAHSVGEGRVRLILCPALRQLFDEFGCAVVEELPAGLTHAQMVAMGAERLSAGEVEGIVVAFDRPDGQTSLRKWKNSSEGGGVSRKYAAHLAASEEQARDLASRGLLDTQVVDMLVTLRAVALADTQPAKVGRVAWNAQQHV